MCFLFFLSFCNDLLSIQRCSYLSISLLDTSFYFSHSWLMKYYHLPSFSAFTDSFLSFFPFILLYIPLSFPHFLPTLLLSFLLSFPLSFNWCASRQRPPKLEVFTFFFSNLTLCQKLNELHEYLVHVLLVYILPLNYLLLLRYNFEFWSCNT